MTGSQKEIEILGKVATFLDKVSKDSFDRIIYYLQSRRREQERMALEIKRENENLRGQKDD